MITLDFLYAKQYNIFHWRSQMKTEYEVRFLEIDKEEVLKKLHKLGAKEVGNWLQIRKTYDLITPTPNSWVRLRTNGKKTTLTVKEIGSAKVDGTKEAEIVVDNFAETDLILSKIGLKARNYQENRRQQFVYNGVEIDIDTWPLIPTFLEIEGENEEVIKDTCKALGLDYSKATSMDVTDIHNKIYSIDLLSIKTLTFNNPEKQK